MRNPTSIYNTKNFYESSKHFHVTLGVYLSLFAAVFLPHTTMATSDLAQVSSGNALFANGFYNAIAKQEKGNIFFSPLSAHTVLAMAYQGSAGGTEKAFSSTLNIPSKAVAAGGYSSVMGALNNVPNVTLHIANKIFVMKDFPLKVAFKTSVTKSFLSEAESVNFGDNQNTAGIINKWVEDKTNNKIKDLISADALNALTRLVLVNAVYFKGNWKHQFSKEATRTEPFYINNNDKIDCQMMHTTKHFRYAEDEELDAQILELPYNNEDVSMVIVLPRARDGIADLEKKLANVDLSTLTQKLRSMEVEVSLPKFKIETDMDLKDVLSQLGLGVIFEESNANFSEISESPEQLYVSKVIQKAFIEVNEEGAEAAAATGMLIRRRRCIEESERFIADHPFLFCITKRVDNSHMILFSGKVSVLDSVVAQTHDEL